uniref:Integrase, catalytic region, zinc finger, CCHC-type, peptidase aspartic, catalytic n=1 Tax=Tanacetum cinerariifolium TaxID=118510 RepID=A0A6L2NHA9_TANCI|nr:integrase, catalytic region, zinc finger, CCHC-type, peptidase aspartic, catalytic [Tanacetum cinerariifolium]
MILPSKDNLYNGRKGIGFENPSYFEKAKDLRPTFYDEKVIGLGYVNEKINFSDDYFQKIINPDFEKLDSSFQQTSLLKPYVPNVILEKIIIDLEDELVSLLEKEKENLKTIKSLKSNGFESSENAISESKNQSENDYLEVEKECDKMENPKVIAPGMFKLSVSQTISSSLMSKTSCESNNVESKLKRKRRKRKSSKQNDKQVDNDVSRGCSKHMKGNRALLTNFMEKFLGTVRFGNNDFAVIVGYGDVVIGSMTIKKVYYVEGLGHNLFSGGQFCDKGLEVAFRKSTCFVQNEDGVDLLTGDRSSNLYTIALNEVASNSSTCLLAKASSSQSWLWPQRLSHLNFATINNLVKNNLVQGLPKMIFEKDHLWMCDSFDENNLFIFDDESVRISPVSKMPFRKKPRDSMNVCFKSNSNKSLSRTVHMWLLKMQPALLTNFVEKFLGTVRSGNNNFAVIDGYGDVVIESMSIKKFTMSKA